jgi:hypothetical protein
MAREAGMHRSTHNLASNPVQHLYSYDGYEENLELFAKLVAAAAKEEMLMDGNDQWLEEARKAEREACAKVCDDDKTQAMEWMDTSLPGGHFAAAIRARGNT